MSARVINSDIQWRLIINEYFHVSSEACGIYQPLDCKPLSFWVLLIFSKNAWLLWSSPQNLCVTWFHSRPLGSIYRVIWVIQLLTFSLFPVALPRTRAKSGVFNISLVPPRVEIYTALHVAIVHQCSHNLIWWVYQMPGQQYEWQQIGFKWRSLLFFLSHLNIIFDFLTDPGRSKILFRRYSHYLVLGWASQKHTFSRHMAAKKKKKKGLRF